MTYQHDCSVPEEFLEPIIEEGLDALPGLIQTLINTAMRIERQLYIGAAPYERSDQRRGYANGYASGGPRLSRHVWEKSRLTFRKYATAGSIRAR